MKWINEKENLYKLIYNDKLPYDTIGKMYNCTGGNIRKVCRKLNISLPSRRCINECETFNKGKRSKEKKCLYCGNLYSSPHLTSKFCSNKCCNEYKTKERYQYYLNNQEEFKGKEINYKWIKKQILKEQDYKCSICGIHSEWNGKELHLILDHINGDACDNTRKNLRCICPNCDSQLDTYKSRNTGKSTRKYKPYRIYQ